MVLWGFSWSDILPYRIGNDGVVVVGSSFDRALPFIHNHYAEIFHEDPTVSPFVTKVDAAVSATTGRRATSSSSWTKAGRSVY